MKKIAITGLTILILFLTGCSNLNSEQKDSVRAFGDVIDKSPVEEYEPNRWRLTAPDGTAWFAFDNMSICMVVDTTPFVVAGADLSKIDNAGEHNLNPGKESIFFNSPGFDMLNQNVKDSPLAQFEYDISCLNKYISYNKITDCYVLDFDDGNMFEWANDVVANDKSIVFVLNPEQLIAAGADPENVDGWTYTQVEIEENGKKVEVYKFLKYFDIR